MSDAHKNIVSVTDAIEGNKKTKNYNVKLTDNISGKLKLIYLLENDVDTETEVIIKGNGEENDNCDKINNNDKNVLFKNRNPTRRPLSLAHEKWRHCHFRRLVWWWSDCHHERNNENPIYEIRTHMDSIRTRAATNQSSIGSSPSTNNDSSLSASSDTASCRSDGAYGISDYVAQLIQKAQNNDLDEWSSANDTSGSIPKLI